MTTHKQRDIIVVDYDAAWIKQYELAAQEIRAILCDELIDIHHIGSTSVPGLAAKPILDIMPIVKNIKRIDAYQEQFEKLGYTAMGEYGIAGRRFFLRGVIDRTHHIHIFDLQNQEDIDRHLALPLYLQQHEKDRIAYGKIKKEMAKRFPHDIQKYCDGKDAFVKDLQQRALQWYMDNKHI